MTAFALCAILAVVALAYLPALGLGFYGDDWIFYDLAGRLSLPDYVVKYFDPRVQTAWYRPVQGVIFRVEYLLFGSNLLGYHLFNVLVHLANCCLLYKILFQVTRNWRVGLAAALCFGTLPTAALAVFWPGVIDVVETFFTLSAIFFWFAYLSAGRRRDYVLAFIAFLCALLSKEIGLFLPVVLFLLDRLVVRMQTDWRTLVRRYAPFVAALLCYLPIEYLVVSRSVFVNQIGYAPDVLRLAANLAEYLAVLAFPWRFLPPISYVWLLIVLGAMSYAIVIKRWLGLVPVVVGGVLAVMPVVPFPFVAARFLYLSLTATAVLFALALERLATRFSWRWLALPLAGVIAIGGLGVSNAAEAFGEWGRVSRVAFRNVRQAHPTLPDGSLVYFVRPPVPASNLSGMLFWQYGAKVQVGSDDFDRAAGFREHPLTLVYYFDDDGNQHEQQVESTDHTTAVPALPARFDVPIRLEGYELASASVQREESILLVLYWRALARISQDYVVSVQLTDETGIIAAGHEREPRQGRTPTSAIEPGQLVVDVVQLRVPAQARPGNYELHVGLVDPNTRKSAKVIPSDGQAGAERVIIKPVAILE